MDLRSKLNLYLQTQAKSTRAPEEGSGQHPDASRRRDPDTSRGRDVDVLIPGTVLENEHGCCYVIEEAYHPGCIHGGCRIGDAMEISSETLSVLGGPDCGGLKADRLLYLDTETSGLAGGTGTVEIGRAHV